MLDVGHADRPDHGAGQTRHLGHGVATAHDRWMVASWIRSSWINTRNRPDNPIHGAGQAGHLGHGHDVGTDHDLRTKVTLDRAAASSVELSEVLIPAMAPVMIVVLVSPRLMIAGSWSAGTDRHGPAPAPGTCMTDRPHGAGQVITWTPWPARSRRIIRCTRIQMVSGTVCMRVETTVGSHLSATASEEDF